MYRVFYHAFEQTFSQVLEYNFGHILGCVCKTKNKKTFFLT